MTRAPIACILLSCASLVASCAKPDGAAKPEYSISMKVAERLQKVQDHVDREDYQAALAELDQAAQGSKLNPYEEAKLLEVRGAVHSLMGQPDQAVAHIEQALALQSLPGEEQSAARYNLARAYAQAERYSEAVSHAARAVEDSENPPEAWLELLASLHYELEQNAELAAVLERLAEAYPKKEHLLQLSATYLELGQDERALAALERAHDKGMLESEKELTGLARLRMQYGSAAEGASLLDASIKGGKVARTPQNLTLLAQTWVAAGEGDRAAAALAAAGDGIANGDIYHGLARLEATRGRWEQARDALANAIRKGGLRAPGDAQLLLGIAHFHTKRKDAAIASLTAAKRHGPEAAKCADAWIKAIRRGKAADVGCPDISADSGTARK